jgi:hypothetical protein
VVEIEAKKPNITTKQISEPSVAIVVKTHFELDTTIIEVDNQVALSMYKLGRTLLRMF